MLQANKFQKKKKISSNDIERGLVLDFDLAKFKQPLDLNTKFKIYIENASTFFIAPGKSDNGDSISIPAGENVIKVTRELTKRTESLKEKCLIEKDKSYPEFRLVNLFNQLKITYLQGDCFDLCAFENFCGFSYTDNDFESKTKELLLSKNLFKTCITRASDEGEINSNETIQEKCNKECPLECESFEYKTSHRFLGHYFSQNSNVAESKLKLKVYYPKLGYVLLTKFVKISSTDLFAQLGGVVGVFFSVNIFTFAEILIIFVEVISDYLRKKTYQRKMFDFKLNSIQETNKIEQEKTSRIENNVNIFKIKSVSL